MQSHQCLLTLLVLGYLSSVTQAVISDQFHSNFRQQVSNESSASLPQSSSIVDRPGCPPECHCSVHASRLKVNCYSSGLRKVPPEVPPDAVELDLSVNSLNVEGRELWHLTRLEWLSITQNNLTYLGRNVFSKLSALKFLDLSMNRLISSSLDGALESLGELQRLNLTRNALSSISRSSFKDLLNLKSLDLSRNKLIYIDKNAFVMLFDLEHLDLSFNGLTNLEHEWFQSLGRLVRLDLSKNEIHSINNLMFWSLNNMQKLDLSTNRINSVGSLSFKGLVHIHQLDLSYNNISTIQEGALRPLANLETFHLSNNPVSNINNIFLTSQNLRQLYMFNLTKLQRITSTSLLGLVGLETLLMSHSGISSIDKNAFVSLTKLRTLALESNHIETMFMGTLGTVTSLKSLYLKGNPWKCDCLVHWILRWLGEHVQSHLVSPIDTMCHYPEPLRGIPLLDALDHKMVCINATIIRHTQEATFQIGSSAILQCEMKGNPPPTLTWVTPKKHLFHWSLHNSSANVSHPASHGIGLAPLEEEDANRFVLLNNGDFAIRQVLRGDSGLYGCVVSNPLNNATATIRVAVDSQYMVRIKIISFLVGVAVAFCFLLLTLLVNVVCAIMTRCGIECPCCLSCSPKAQQIRRMLESVEQYKSQQLERLRDNYTLQVQRIKDNCMQQMERLRESYSGQAERLRDICDYGTQQIDRIRDNYYMQVSKVRDYSTFQIDRLRENYVFQRNRIRKFSAHQMFKLRENYKLQQQHLNKILETLNIESCKTGCARTDSVIFEPDDPMFAHLDGLIGEPIVHIPLDRMDSASQVSAYFTPDDVGSVVSSSDGKPQHNRIHRETLPLVSHRDVAVSTTDLQEVMVHVQPSRSRSCSEKLDQDRSCSEKIDQDSSSDQLSIPATESTTTDGNGANETLV